MKKKKSDEKKNHDESIWTLANKVTKDNWELKANVEGSEKPSKLGIFTPDIVARKGGLKRICEVLTEKDFGSNKQRYIEFKAYCDEYDFHFYVINKNGKRQKIEPDTFVKK